MQHSHPRFARVRMVGCLALVAATGAMVGAQQPDAQQVLNLGLRGVYFVPNHGQWSDSNVYFGLHSRGLDVALRESTLTMHLSSRPADPSPDRLQTVSESNGEGVGLAPPSTTEQLTLTVTFPGSNAIEPIGAQPQGAKFNYFVGGEGRNSAADIPSFAEVVYENLYEDIDLHVTGSDDGILKYEFHVAPGADYNQIQIHYDGIESLCIDDAGDLYIETRFGIFTDAAPLGWQADRANLGSRFELVDRASYRIVIEDDVDVTLPLVIDPDVDWMTYLGGTGDEGGDSVAVGPGGNVFVAGRTTSSNFEGKTNSYHCCDDAFVAQLNPAGALQWMTYLGGSSSDGGRGISVDSEGRSLVTGITASSDFSNAMNDHHGSLDAFVARLDGAGSVEWARFLGGAGQDYAWAVAIDDRDQALIGAFTESVDFEGRINEFRGDADAAVINVDTEGQIIWMTYLGGSGREACYGIGVDTDGNVFVTGDTSSTDFTGRANEHHGGNAWDAFAAIISSSGEQQWMVYLGGTASERGNGISADQEGHLRVAGRTESADFEGRSNAIHGATDAFLVKIDALGALQWMSYLGGTDGDFASALVVDAGGVGYLAGYTYSDDFEGRTNESRGGTDAFVVAVDSESSIEWMQYLGGSQDQLGRAIALDRVGNLLVSGETTSVDFEGRTNSYHGGGDVFLVRLRQAGVPELSITATCPSGGPIQIAWSNATPSGQIALLFARGTGSVTIPNGRPCAGTTLGLGSGGLLVVYNGHAGADGSRTVNSTADPSACGGSLQLLDLTTCATSNVARIE